MSSSSDDHKNHQLDKTEVAKIDTDNPLTEDPNSSKSLVDKTEVDKSIDLTNHTLKS